MSLPRKSRLSSDEKLGAHHDRSDGRRSRCRVFVHRGSPLHVGNVGALRYISVPRITILTTSRTIQPKEIRGTIVASYQFLITIGILVANLINYGTRTIEDSDASWRIVIGIGIFFSLPLGIGIMFAPER